MFESRQTTWEQEKLKLQGDLTDVEASLAKMSAQYSDQVNELNVSFNASMHRFA